MQIPKWNVLLIATVLIGLVGAFMFMLGRESSSPASPRKFIETTTPRQSALQPSSIVTTENAEGVESLEAETRNLVGVWAFAETGCGAGYGSAYSVSQRFQEGDEFSGIEGKWLIRDGMLERQNVLRYEATEETEAKIVPLSTHDSFPILKLTAHELIFSEGTKVFSYVKCPDGHFEFADGEKVQG